jgi:HK97 family phage prohead protease
MLIKNAAVKTKRLDFVLSQATVTKAADGSDECIIEGYANTSTKDRVGDVVLPSAFEKSLPTYLSNPILLANHDWNDPCGKVLEAKITDKGLWIKARVSDTRPDIKTLIREGCLRTFSIGYNEVDADFDESTKTKYVKELELLEISIVTVPANTEAMFTEAVAKAEDPAAPKSEGKSAELKTFIDDVKAALGSDLNTHQVLALCDYFYDSEEDEMKTKQKTLKLIETLRQKSGAAPAAAPAAGEKAPDPAAPAAAPAAGGDADVASMLKQVLAKLETLGSAVAQLMEGKQEAPKEEPKKDEAPKEEPKKDEPKKQEPAPEAPKEGAADDEDEEDDEELSKEIEALEAELAELEDVQEA